MTDLPLKPNNLEELDAALATLDDERCRKMIREFYAFRGLLETGILILHVNEEYQPKLKCKTIGVDSRMINAFIYEHITLLWHHFQCERFLHHHD